MGTRPGSDRPRCRRSTPELPQPVPAAAQIRAQERAQEARSHPGGCCPSSRPDMLHTRLCCQIGNLTLAIILDSATNR